MMPVVELDSVSKLYGSFVALRKISLTIDQGRCYVLLGENGAGKSTLLRLMAARKCLAKSRRMCGIASDI